MALGDFYGILEAIVGTPANDAQIFVLYTLSSVLGMFIIFFVFELFRTVSNMSKSRR